MDTIRIERRDVGALLVAIDEAAAVITAPDFRLVYAFRRSAQALRGEADAIQDAMQPSAALLAFEQAREALCLTYTLRDEGGAPQMTSGSDRPSYRIDPERRAAFDAEFSALRDQNQAALDAESARAAGVSAWLREEIDVQVHRFPLELLTRCGESRITAQMFMRLIPLVIDAEERAAA